MYCSVRQYLIVVISLAADYLQEGTEYRTINIFIKCFCRFKMIGDILRVLVRAVSTVVLQVAENILRNTNLPIEKHNYALFVSRDKGRGDVINK